MTAPDLPTPDDLARLREAAEQYGFDSLRLLFRAYDAVVAERDEARAAVRDLLVVADRDAICCTSCSNAAVAIDSNFAYCDEHLSLADGRLRELSYAAAMRRGRAIVAALPPEAGDG